MQILDNKSLQLLLEFGKYKDFVIDNLNTKLFGYQKSCLFWMLYRENHNICNNSMVFKGGIIADDMGLGKSLTILS